MILRTLTCENEESLQTLTVKLKSPCGISLLLCCDPVECDGGNDQLTCWSQMVGLSTTIKMKMTDLQRSSGIVNEDITD
jgi:hypothetical protein